eukprot:TRINITY_DN21073_c0_g1_i1.p1 TRINITY_DN21073_c0_g1~~TRINITY_DN21073_c0_g1_i1.p1  ORF type:complete len:505 (+),score=128.02 TRINITY_DN21073_c0_g1_i1:27-1541(+)
MWSPLFPDEVTILIISGCVKGNLYKALDMSRVSKKWEHIIFSDWTELDLFMLEGLITSKHLRRILQISQASLRSICFPTINDYNLFFTGLHYQNLSFMSFHNGHPPLEYLYKIPLVAPKLEILWVQSLSSDVVQDIRLQLPLLRSNIVNTDLKEVKRSLARSDWKKECSFLVLPANINNPSKEEMMKHYENLQREIDKYKSFVTWRHFERSNFIPISIERDYQEDFMFHVPFDEKNLQSLLVHQFESIVERNPYGSRHLLMKYDRWREMRISYLALLKKAVDQYEGEYSLAIFNVMLRKARKNFFYDFPFWCIPWLNNQEKKILASTDIPFESLPSVVLKYLFCDSHSRELFGSQLDKTISSISTNELIDILAITVDQAILRELIQRQHPIEHFPYYMLTLMDQQVPQIIHLKFKAEDTPLCIIQYLIEWRQFHLLDILIRKGFPVSKYKFIIFPEGDANAPVKVLGRSPAQELYFSKFPRHIFQNNTLSPLISPPTLSHHPHS